MSGEGRCIHVAFCALEANFNDKALFVKSRPAKGVLRMRSRPSHLIFVELRRGEVGRDHIPRPLVNKGIGKNLVLRASSKRTILVSDRALSHAKALRGSLPSVYASLFQGGKVEAKNPAPQMGA
jgi:hypothetical protein